MNICLPHVLSICASDGEKVHEEVSEPYQFYINVLYIHVNILISVCLIASLKIFCDTSLIFNESIILTES